MGNADKGSQPPRDWSLEPALAVTLVGRQPVLKWKHVGHNLTARLRCRVNAAEVHSLVLNQSNFARGSGRCGESSMMSANKFALVLQAGSLLDKGMLAGD